VIRVADEKGQGLTIQWVKCLNRIQYRVAQ